MTEENELSPIELEQENEKSFKKLLEKKIKAYRELFKAGNLSPHEKQVSLWMAYTSNEPLFVLGNCWNLYKPRNRGEIEWRVRQKIDFYLSVGLLKQKNELTKRYNLITNNSPKIETRKKNSE